MESWKEIKGFEGKYEVSNMGQVRSVDRIEKFRSATRKRFGRIMKQRQPMGYSTVQLKNYDKGKTYLVHRLVADAFIGDISGKVVDHIDFNPSNNRLDNLQIITQRENIHRSVNADRHNYGTKHGMAKLDNDKVASLRSANKGSIAGLCSELGISYSTAKRIRRNETWKHV